MFRALVFTCAALLFAGSPARAEGLCEAAEQRAGQTYSKSDKDRQDKDKKDQPPPGREGPKKWWIDAELRRELGITDQQSAAIEQEWQKSLPQRAQARDRLEKLDAVLQKMILEAADEAAVTAQLDRVGVALAESNKARMQMLYRMNRLLTQEQRAKVKAMMERRRDGGRRGPASR